MEYMKLTRRGRIGCTYQSGKSIEVGHLFYRIPQFKNLGGVLLTQDNDLKSEIARKIQLANKCYFGAGTLLKFRLISINLKIKMYMILISPIILSGLETWERKRKSD